MERFKEGLWKALRRSTFFPAPKEIEDSCEGLRRAAGELIQASETRALLDDMEAAAKHRREHPEEYVSMGELIAEAEARIAAKKAAEPKPVATPATPTDLVSQETLDRMAQVKAELEYTR